MRVGRLDLHPHRTGLSRAGDTLSLAGTVEPYDPAWRGVAVSREQIIGMQGQLVPVSWPHDGKLDGFWHVDSAQAVAQNLIGPRARIQWQVGLTRVARGTVDFESVLVGDTLTNVHGLTGTRWHSPPAGVTGYWSDPLPETPYVSRLSTDGAVRVWREVPTHTLWSVDPDGFYAGASRIRQNAAVVTGSMLEDAPGVFELDNGLVRARFIVGEIAWDDLDGTWDDMGDLTWEDLDGFSGVEIATWHNGEWRRKQWEVRRAGAVFTPSKVAVIRNTPHVCSVRLVEERAPGRTTLDLTLRRGARHVQGFMRTELATLEMRRATAEAGSTIVGGLKASAADPDGVRYTVASPHTISTDTMQGAISRTADRLAFMVGGTPSIAGGQSPESMVGQWAAATDEAVRAVLR